MSLYDSTPLIGWAGPKGLLQLLSPYQERQSGASKDVAIRRRSLSEVPARRQCQCSEIISRYEKHACVTATWQSLAPTQRKLFVRCMQRLAGLFRGRNVDGDFGGKPWTIVVNSFGIRRCMTRGANARFCDRNVAYVGGVGSIGHLEKDMRIGRVVRIFA